MKIKFKGRNEAHATKKNKKRFKYKKAGSDTTSKPQMVYDLGANNVYGLNDSFTDDDESLLLISPSYDYFPSLQEEAIGKARITLYKTHLAAKGTEVIWQFCLVLFLMALTGYQSLALVSSYGLFSGLVVFMASSATGKFIDSGSYSRLDIAKIFIWVQNLSVIIATLCCFFLLRMVKEAHVTPDTIQRNRFGGSNLEARVSLTHLLSDFVPPINISSLLLLIGIHVFGAISKLTDQMLTVAMERDWIVVMSEVAAMEDEDQEDEILTTPRSLDSQHSFGTFSVGQLSFGGSTTLNKTMLQKMKKETWLSQTNTSMTQIDLLCQFVGPAIAGIYVSIFDDANPSNSIEVELSHWYNLSYGAIFIGFLNLICLYIEYSCTKSIYNSIPALSIKEGNNEISRKSCSIFQMLDGLSLYMKQPIAAGGIALALLYLNVLSFGGLMTGYLIWVGVPLSVIGIFRSISSIIGILGTVAFHISSYSHGLAKTGMWSITFQFACLSLSVISFLFQNHMVLQTFLLVFGVCVSRIGLWTFDLTITQYMQQLIPSPIRGEMGGVQNSLEGLFEILTFVMGIYFPSARQFVILAGTGYCSVAVAMTLYAAGVFWKQEKLATK